MESSHEKEIQFGWRRWKRIAVMAYVKTAMREAGFSKKERSEYVEDCMRGDYDRLLIISDEMIDRCNRQLGF